MAVYIDSAIWVWRNQKWCHLVADNLEELHAFAQSIGMKKEWFQSHTKYPHYDLTEKRRAKALTKGALYVNRKTIIEKAKILKAEYQLLITKTESPT